MLAKDIEIGLRVYVQPNNSTGRGVVRSELYRPRASVVRLKHGNSTRFDLKLNHQLTALPLAEQYPALGGSYVKPEGDF